MFNSVCFTKNLDNRQWNCGKVSNGTYYWSEKELLNSKIRKKNELAKDFNDYVFAKNYQYLDLTPEHANLILNAIVNNDTYLELNEVTIPAMICVFFKKYKVEILKDMIILNEESKSTFQENYKDAEYIHTTYNIPKSLFIESMGKMPLGYSFDFWADKVFSFIQDSEI